MSSTFSKSDAFSNVVFRIVTGTYNKGLIGVKCTKRKYSTGEDSDMTPRVLTPLFAYTAHDGCVKAIACKGSMMATGSTDEIIKIYNLKKQQEIGELVHHQGAVTCLEFYKNSHLFSAGVDGLLCIWRSSDWECIGEMRSKYPINGIAVHDSGRLALTVSTDARLRLWDLMKGRCAYKTKLDEVPQDIFYSPTFAMFAILYDFKIALYDAMSNELLVEIEPEKQTRLHTMTFLSNDFIAVGSEDKMLRVFRTDTSECVIELQAHEHRVKSVTAVDYASYIEKQAKESEHGDTGDDDETYNPGLPWIVTTSTDGVIRCWEMVPDSEDNYDPILMAETETKERLTCMDASIRVTMTHAQRLQLLESRKRKIEELENEMKEEEEEELQLEGEQEQEQEEKSSSSSKKKNKNKNKSSGKKKKKKRKTE